MIVLYGSTSRTSRGRAHQEGRAAQFEITPPLLSVIRAGIVLLGYGAIWLSVRDLHLSGPNGAALAAVYAAVIVVVVMTSVVFKRATTGVSGRSLPRRAEIAVLVTSYVAVAVGSAFSGPVGVWAFPGLGLFVVVLGHAAARARLRRA